MNRPVSNLEVKITIALMVACWTCIIGAVALGIFKGFDFTIGVAMAVNGAAFIGLRSMAKRSGWM